MSAPRAVAVVATLGEWHRVDAAVGESHAVCYWILPRSASVTAARVAQGGNGAWWYTTWPLDGAAPLTRGCASLDDGIAQAERALLGDAASQAPVRPSGATPADAPSLAALSDAVRARLGRREDGARCDVAMELYCPRDVACRVDWRRVYADGQRSDSRLVHAPDPISALRAVLAYEDVADAREPEHAGPPPR